MLLGSGPREEILHVCVGAQPRCHYRFPDTLDSWSDMVGRSAAERGVTREPRAADDDAMVCARILAEAAHWVRVLMMRAASEGQRADDDVKCVQIPTEAAHWVHRACGNVVVLEGHCADYYGKFAQIPREEHWVYQGH